jgi:hypothetical protein
VHSSRRKLFFEEGALADGRRQPKSQIDLRGVAIDDDAEDTGHAAMPDAARVVSPPQTAKGSSGINRSTCSANSPPASVGVRSARPRRFERTPTMTKEQKIIRAKHPIRLFPDEP